MKKVWGKTLLYRIEIREQEKSLARDKKMYLDDEIFIRNQFDALDKRTQTLKDFESQTQRVIRRTKRNEKKLEKRINDLESGKFDWIANRYPRACDQEWYQERNILTVFK